MNKEEWLDTAEIIDAFRVMPKLIIIILVLLYSLLSWDVWVWFKGFETLAYGEFHLASIFGFPGLILTGLGAMLTKVITLYLETGRSWEEREHIETTPTCPSCGREHH